MPDIPHKVGMIILVKGLKRQQALSKRRFSPSIAPRFNLNMRSALLNFLKRYTLNSVAN